MPVEPSTWQRSPPHPSTTHCARGPPGAPAHSVTLRAPCSRLAGRTSAQPDVALKSRPAMTSDSFLQGASIMRCTPLEA